MLAEVDSWVGENGGALGPPASELAPDDATPAGLAALRVNLPKPAALREGASAILARLEAEHGALLERSARPARAGREARERLAQREAAQQMHKLSESMEELELVLASSAAAVAGAVVGGGAAGRVGAFYRRLVAAPPIVRFAFMLLLFVAFLGSVYVLNFWGGEEEENFLLREEGVLFAKDARPLEAAQLAALRGAGAEGRAAAEAIAADGDLTLRRGTEVVQGAASVVDAVEAAVDAAARRLLRWRERK